MERKPISVYDLMSCNFKLIGDGLLLTAGDFSSRAYNTMAIGWGSLGVVWGKPFAQVFVRPTRYTYEFMEKYDTFTIAGFPADYRDKVMMLGTKSGRDGDKIKESGLTLIPSSKVGAPGFAEAELIIECKKIYSQDLAPGNFLADYIMPMYDNDYHRQYFGEILAVFGANKYLGK
ncbi:MAG: flavin reductase [Bacillota bacterium]